LTEKPERKKLKVKVPPEQTTNFQRGNGSIDLRFYKRISSSKPETFFINGMEKWIERVKKCMAINGDYVEK